MDLGYLTEYYNPVVLVATWIVGYCIKHINQLDKVSNEYIPTILAIRGAALACVSAVTTGNTITLDIVVSGSFTGLASTGLHQAFTQIINKESNDKEGE